MRSVALDLGATSISYCEVRGGSVIARMTVRNLDKLESVLGPNTQPARVAIEACREAWHVHDTLKSWGHWPLIVDTTRTRRIGVGQHGRKNDRLDAEALARAMERNDLPAAHVLSPARRELRAALQVRATLVGTRADLIVSVRGHARARGCRVRVCDSGRFVEQAVRTLASNDEIRAVVAPQLAVVQSVDQQIALAEQRLHGLCEREPMVAKLATVPGVGMITAAAFVAVIDTPTRFHNAHAVQSYIGLVPSESSSGGPDRVRLGHITKHGNGMLRALLVESAQALINSRLTHDPLRLWALTLLSRGRKRSVVAVALARRIAGVLWALWRDDAVYDPAMLARRSAEGTAAASDGIFDRATILARAARKLANVKSETRRLARRRAHDLLEVTTGR